MNLKTQKRLAARVLKCAEKRVAFDPKRLDDLNEAITKLDIKSLIEDNAITAKQKKGVSRVRARKRQVQKRRGQRRGLGKRKGKTNAREPRKQVWENRIRALRTILQNLKERGKIDNKNFRMLYRKATGGFFRSKRHLKLFIEEHGMIKK